MKFLCLAYGDEEGWNTLTSQEKEEVLAQDEIIAKRGNLMGPVRPEVTTISNWDGNLEVMAAPYAAVNKLPLAGFSVIEAQSIEEVIAMVADTPCARARGFIEVRPFWNTQPEA